MMQLFSVRFVKAKLIFVTFITELLLVVVYFNTSCNCSYYYKSVSFLPVEAAAAFLSRTTSIGNNRKRLLFQQQIKRSVRYLLKQNSISSTSSSSFLHSSRDYQQQHIIQAQETTTRKTCTFLLLHQKQEQEHLEVSMESDKAAATTDTSNSTVIAKAQQQQPSDNEVLLETIKMPISSNILETLEPCVVLMKQIINKYLHLWENDDGIYSLAQGIVYWDPPQSSMTAIIDALQAQQQPSNTTSNIHTYCPAEGIPELREAIINKLHIENNITNHNVMITSGANQAYINCILTLMDNKAKAIVFAPYYFNHVMAYQMIYGSTNNIDSTLLIGPTTTITGIPDIQWLQQQLEQYNTNNDSKTMSGRINIVTIVNPGNPTGIYMNRTIIEPFVTLCQQYNVWLIIDATYEYFIHSDDDNTDTNNTDTTPINYDCYFNDASNVIYISSFSKSYSLAGYRCGYIVLHNDLYTTVYQQMLKVQDTIPICPSRISQIAAYGAMINAGRSWVQEQIQTLHQSRIAIRHALSPLLLVVDDNSTDDNSDNVRILGGTGAMYFMAKLPTSNRYKNDIDVATMLVRDYGVAVIPGSFCGYPGWIRVCYSNLHPSKCLLAAQRLHNGLSYLMEDSKQE